MTIQTLSINQDNNIGCNIRLPYSSGIFALVLEANPNLSWRDLQHLIVNTSKKTDKEDPEWRINGAGHHVNIKYGFGVLDTAALVDMATNKHWKTAKEQHVCRELGTNANHVIPQGGTFTSTLFTDGCVKKTNCVTRLEHVRVYISISHPKRGELSINLTSPSGTVHELLKPRHKDYSGKGFDSWPFMTVFSWGENPRGIWTLHVKNQGLYVSYLSKWSLRMYGTCEQAKPQITQYEHRICNQSCRKGCPTKFSDACNNCSYLYCHCGTGQCTAFCEEDDEVNEAARHCVPPVMENTNDTDDSATGELSTFVKWLIIFSLLAILVATVLIMYLFKTSGKFCWARPAVEKTTTQAPRRLVRNSTPTASIKSTSTDHRRRSEPRQVSVFPKTIDPYDGPNSSNTIYI